jgi:hypothetical protein
MALDISTIFGNVFAIFGQVLPSQALQSLEENHLKNQGGYL